MIIRCGSIHLIYAAFLTGLVGLNVQANEQQQEETWWQKRHQRPDIFYPHNAHQDIMQEQGDPCLLCHSFSANQQLDPEKVKALTIIANEPLEAICHDCHVDKREAPLQCQLCHPDKSRIWPEDHNYNYLDHHAEDARQNERACEQCHVDQSFCSDCHFQRDRSQHQQHRLGYRLQHGLDARINTASCASCHSATYCADCHRGQW